MHRTLRVCLVAALLSAPLLAACGDDDTSDPPSTTAGGGAAAATLEVRGTDELKFDAEAYEAEAGTIDVTYVNDGSIAHTLLVKDVNGFKLAVTGSGDRDEGSVELEAGEYTLYCDVAGHESAGMVATLTVS